VKDRLLALSRRIRAELVELERLVERTQEGWRRAQRASDDYYLDGVALNLHGFYAGLERLQVPSVLERLRPELLAFADLLQQRATRADS
jgi:hypothetical protein